MIKKFNAIKAEAMLPIAQFILKEHKNPILRQVSKWAARANKRRYGKDALDFLDEEATRDADF